MSHSAPGRFQVDGSTLRIRSTIDLGERHQVECFRKAAVAIADSGSPVVTLDFTEARILTSTIITLTFLVSKDLNTRDVCLQLRVSMRSHRALVAAGLGRFVELSLCS